MSALNYKGYIGRVEFDPEAEIFHGRVVNVNDVITFEGRTVDELKQAFKDSVEDYLAFCKELGQNPDQPRSGQLRVRLGPELHSAVASAASIEGVTMNTYIVKALSLASSATISRGAFLDRESKRSKKKKAATG